MTDKRSDFKRFLIGKFNYPFRVALTTLAIFSIIYDFNLDHDHLKTTIIFSGILLLWPHLAYYWYAKEGYAKKTERFALLADAFFAGLAVCLLDFSLYTSLAFAIIITSSHLALYGHRSILDALLWLCLGALFGIVLVGWHFDLNGNEGLNFVMFLSISVLFVLFALSAYRRTRILNKVKSWLISNRHYLEKSREKAEKAKRRAQKAKRKAIDEHEKAESLLRNILPRPIAEELKEKGKVEPSYLDFCTVMFTDFKEFTILSQKLKLTEILADLQTCFVAFDEIILRNKMEKIKTIGDGYMAAGGLPIANNTNPMDAVKASMEMQAFMDKFNEWKRERGKAVWELKIGLHTGPVVAGVIGKNKFAYDIWGNTVNIASRLESSCEPGRINISEDTYKHVKDNYSCAYRGKIEVKHKGLIEMYFVEKEITND